MSIVERLREHSRDLGVRLRLRSAEGRISEQHRRLDELLEQVIAALDRDDARGIASRLRVFKRAFRAHTEIEERFYFPAVGADRPDLRVTLTGFVRDHADLQRSFDTASLQLRRRHMIAFRATLSELAERLVEHERAEQRIFAEAA